MWSLFTESNVTCCVENVAKPLQLNFVCTIVNNAAIIQPLSL